MSNDNRSSNLDQPLQLSVPAKWLLLHLHNYGGEVSYDVAQDLCSYSWGSLLKNNETKWHDRAVSRKTFDAVLHLLDPISAPDEYLGVDYYILATVGHKAALSLKAVAAGIGGGLGPIFVDVDDAPPADYEPIDVQTELVYLRSRRFITANDCLMAEQLFECQIAAATNEMQLAAISAQWMAQLAALKAVS